MIVKLYINGLFWQQVEVPDDTRDYRLQVYTGNNRDRPFNYSAYEDDTLPVSTDFPFETIVFEIQIWRTETGEREYRANLDDSRVYVDMANNQIRLRPEATQSPPELSELYERQARLEAPEPLQGLGNTLGLPQMIAQQQERQQRIYYQDILSRPIGTASSIFGTSPRTNPFNPSDNSLLQERSTTNKKEEIKKTPIKYLNKFDVMDI